MKRFIEIGGLVLLGITIAGLTAFYKGWLVLPGQAILTVAGISAFLFLMHSIGGETARRHGAMLLLSLCCSLSLWLSGVVYSNWAYTSAITAHGMGKLTMMVSFFTSLYLVCIWFGSGGFKKRKRGDRARVMEMAFRKRKVRMEGQVYFHLGERVERNE